MSSSVASPTKVRPFASLAEWREFNGLTQREAADYLGITQPYYLAIEKHKQAPRPKMAAKIAKLTGVPSDEIQGIAE